MLFAAQSRRKGARPLAEGAHRLGDGPTLHLTFAGGGAEVRPIGGGHTDDGGQVAVWGTACLEPGALDRTCPIDGDFALCAARPQGLLLASGLAGGYRPIYCSWDRASETWFASTRLSALLTALSEPPPLDEDHLCALVLTHPWPEADKTTFRGVHCLPPGEMWVLSAEGHLARTAVELTWDEPTLGEDPFELARMLRNEFRDAALRAVVGEKRVAVAVGGGLDSSALLATVVGLAREHGAFEVDALSWDYRSHVGDDRPFLQQLLEHLGVGAIYESPSMAARWLHQNFVLDGAPAYGPAAPFGLGLMDLARRNGARVLLTGGGGDYAVDADPRLLVEHARHGGLMKSLAAAARLEGPWPGPSWRVWQFLFKPLVRSLLRPLIPDRIVAARRRGQMRRAPSWAGPRLRRHLRGLPLPESVAPPGLHATPCERYAWFVKQSWLIEGMRLRGQHEAAVDCVHREPYLDARFLRFVARIPPDLLWHGNLSRGLFREAMRGVIPEGVRLRRSKALQEPMLTQCVEAAGGFGALRPLATVRILADLGMVEPKPFLAAFDEWARLSRDYDWMQVWPVIAIEGFLRAREAMS
jgi:asparagine synthase (glutamine-hydrolysing)